MYRSAGPWTGLLSNETSTVWRPTGAAARHLSCPETARWPRTGEARVRGGGVLGPRSRNIDSRDEKSSEHETAGRPWTASQEWWNKLFCAWAIGLSTLAARSGPVVLGDGQPSCSARELGARVSNFLATPVRGTARRHLIVGRCAPTTTGLPPNPPPPRSARPTASEQSDLIVSLGKTIL